ncbi:hypothetical protein OH492_26575 [Vibrio chagasii]|nr:hypothetical protein [Vibrio chagasii]
MDYVAVRVVHSTHFMALTAEALSLSTEIQWADLLNDLFLILLLGFQFFNRFATLSQLSLGI